MKMRKTYQKNLTKMWPFNKKRKVNTQKPILNGVDVTDPTIDPVEKKWPCVELTIDLDYKDFCIRLWIDRTKDKEYDSVESIVGFITIELAYLDQTKERQLGRPATREEVQYFLAHALLDLNAIQVMDKHSHDGARFGKVIYCVDFAEDVHG